MAWSAAPALSNGSSHGSRRRPRCRIGLWALVATALSVATCKTSGAVSANANVPSVGVGGWVRPGGWGAVEQLRGGAAEGGGGRSSSRRKQADKHAQRETLYDAYNMLHTLAQDFHKPFDSPAVLVVGHQTSGKSALIEALMGFQFNQVGGGTKTRRPIALRMQYNPDCDQPRCYLALEDGKEEPRSLQEIQAYIESENRRLERDPVRSFDSREINIRMEYRFCPNMILIDTPGLIHAPSGSNLNAEQRAVAAAAKEAENLVIQKMRCQDYVILCVEDTTDWKHATTRNIVTQVDHDLSRTVLVTTKLDTKLPQFGGGDDLQDFLRAPSIQRMYRCMLGGPFFTTVPSGRVGRARDSAYFSNEAFVHGVRRSERDDQMLVAAKLGPQAAPSCLPRVGVSRLRRFLERRVEECYRRNVARIVPLLQQEMSRAEGRLLTTEQEIDALSLESLKASADEYREHFSRALGRAIQGTIKAPPEKFGETLEAEQLRAGSFIEDSDVDADQWERLMEIEVGNGENKLFGGAQYHRALREFNFAIRHMNAPEVSEDEIANAAGISDMHDGVNFMRAACVIAVDKARTSFEPTLDALRVRTVHVMKRLFGVVEHMLKSDGMQMSDTHQKPFSFIVKRVYEKFVEKAVDETLARCRDDLTALTRFVTWDLHERSAGALRRSLPDSSMVHIYSLADYFNLQQLMEEASSSRDAERTSAVVSALVQHIMLSWREHFARAVAMKFNCFFLMPFVDDFPSYLRRELEKVYEGDVGDIFDIAEARGALVRRRESLVAECKACHEIQGKFDSINSQLNNAKEIYKDGDQDLEATAAEAAAEAEADAIAEREMEAAAAAAAGAAAAAEAASTRDSGTAMTRDYGGIDSLEDDEMMAFSSSGGGGGGGGGFSSEGNGGRSFFSAGGGGFSSAAGTVAGRTPAPGYGRNFFAPSEDDSSEEDEDEDEDMLFVNPVAYMGPIGEKPPPVDSFDRRRRRGGWVPQPRLGAVADREGGERAAEEVDSEGGGYRGSFDSASSAAAAAARLSKGWTGTGAGAGRVGRGGGGDEAEGDIGAMRGGSSSSTLSTSMSVPEEESVRYRQRRNGTSPAATGDAAGA
ncbi:ARC5, dynamin-related protein involved in plastid division [Ectocarpus siliculosus]|uniref:ARC5, dynamin-related protein involved in plastid division n=1 Tax=Ectocarpus siliculosus TaxID=2880 RepID=D8LDP8_ECTSI|nr:ARC5, dynamin-related protein involved in plastid division [Ectocarpus siliculosus]|eukprot:CBN78455.1 ARC5, dynamin-related protein involved in plastid division [Ectocarpus siliculosus]